MSGRDDLVLSPNSDEENQLLGYSSLEEDILQDDDNEEPAKDEEKDKNEVTEIISKVEQLQVLEEKKKKETARIDITNTANLRKRKRERSLVVYESRSPKRQRYFPQPAKIHIGNLDDRASGKRLYDAFDKFGRIAWFDDKHLSRGFLYVQYENVDDAEEAIKRMDGKIFDGRIITVAPAKPKDTRNQYQYQQHDHRASFPSPYYEKQPRYRRYYDEHKFNYPKNDNWRSQNEHQPRFAPRRARRFYERRF